MFDETGKFGENNKEEETPQSQNNQDEMGNSTTNNGYSYSSNDIIQDDYVENTNEDFAAFEDVKSSSEEPKPSFSETASEPQRESVEPNQNYNNTNFEQPQFNYQQQNQQQQNYQQNYQQQSYQYQNANQAPYAAQPPKSKSKGVVVAIALVGICFVIGIFAMVMSGVSSNIVDNDNTEITANSTEVSSPTLTVPTTQSSSALTQLSAMEVAEKARKSVVGVLVYNSNGQLSDEGSGVFISEQNGETYVITCAHVVESPNSTFSILLLDGTSYEATIVGSDEKTDIAVLKIKATGLPIIEIGDSSSLKIGEVVYAIGNPGGSEFFGSITDGIVSSIDRSVSSTYNLTSIQHNAAINPGNSGGALVNSQGQLVGINSSKISATDFEGMGFAVPTSIAISIAESLMQYGYVPNRPKLGIEYASVSSYQLYNMVVSIKGLPQGSLVIAGISQESSLNGTDAEVGDLIIGVNGNKMTDTSVLLDFIEKGNVGDQLVLNLCRIDNRTYKTTEFDVTISLIEDKGETSTQATTGDYNYGGADSFEDFFSNYFGF